MPIVASYPVLTFIIGITLLGESITIPKVAGVILVSAGVLLLR
ncbi:MAG: EamA family transporter [Actinomycetota bacterium]|nr:EamA family transporter [Actinomycetota bacterium]